MQPLTSIAEDKLNNNVWRIAVKKSQMLPPLSVFFILAADNINSSSNFCQNIVIHSWVQIVIDKSNTILGGTRQNLMEK